MPMSSLTRRDFIVRTAGAAGLGLALPLLSACGLVPRAGSNSGATNGAGASAGSVKTPSFIVIQDGPKADLPGRADGVDAGYFTFPQTLFKSVKEQPGKGEEVSLMTNLIQGSVVPLEQNSAWQAVNQDMGLTVRQRL